MSKSQSYKDLEVYQLAMELAIDIHKMSLTHLPKYEMYEEGSQIRRSSKSIVSNIIEGFGRRRYKNQFVQFITYSLASCDETKGHLEILYKTESLSKTFFYDLYSRYEKLGAKLYKFRQAVIEKHNVFEDGST